MKFNKLGSGHKYKEQKKTFYDDFYNGVYSETVDDQELNIVKYEEQKYLTYDYSKNVAYSFPRFDAETVKSGKIPTSLSRAINNLKDYRAINKYLLDKIKLGDGINWTNKQLSYMRRDAVCKRLWRGVFAPLLHSLEVKNITFIDLTANIGGDVLAAAMQKEVSNVIAYEMDPEVAKLLRNNVKLYEFENVEIRGKFDMGRIGSEFIGSVVMIDPPFEISNNGSHFNLSIARAPIFYIVEALLSVGALFVVLSMPTKFKYNATFAKKYKHRVSVYYVGNKDVKMYVIGRDKRLPQNSAYKIVGGDFVGDYDEDFEKIYSCKLVKLYAE